ncbi:nitrogen fixation protein NifQ [Pelovirga terrestris]|uniref:Nitrogen fixation protein NifQ n=1 Tax=Pelovirga terrestris TaxID=2771352 RepID=A0A8J6QTX4_9BACT|nr:nitrogen fixation protein NifQ [Pelovirga terrestris]MBD1399725.1 nitrogen fixation protein NifQ [Pelovirga terrestris]
MSGYSEQILRYADNPHHVGELAGADGIGEVGLGAEERGARIAVRFFIKTAGRQVEMVRFQAFGCGYTIAACAAAAELAENTSMNEVLRISREAINARLGGLPVDRFYCADLAVEALRAAVAGSERQGERVTGNLARHQDHAGPRVRSDHPRYRQLMDSACSEDMVAADRHLLACLSAVMEEDGCPPEIALGLTSQQFISLWQNYFPDIDLDVAADISASRVSSAVSMDPELVSLLLGFIPAAHEPANRLSGTLLAHILAARAARPGHLWVAMGLFERAELGAAIKRHLPALFAANHQGMRWKRFFYKQICEQQGGLLCKSPVCGECSEYELCFNDGEP